MNGFLSVLLVLVTIFNIVMWIIFGIKFKKIFSTDQVINDTKDQVWTTIQELLNQTYKCISIVDDKIKELKQVSAQAERKVKLMKAEIEAENTTAQMEQIISQSNKVLDQVIDEIDTVKQVARKKSGSVKSTSTKKTKSSKTQDENLGEFFDGFEQQQKAQKKSKIVLQEEPEPESPKMPEAKVPVIKPKIYMAENPVRLKETFSQQVARLSREGYTEEEISAKLGRSVQEVKFTLQYL